jgi:hypothetical protein
VSYQLEHRVISDVYGNSRVPMCGLRRAAKTGLRAGRSNSRKLWRSVRCPKSEERLLVGLFVEDVSLSGELNIA